MKTFMPFHTGVALLSATALITGCCGPKRTHTARYHHSPSAGYSSYGAPGANVDTTTTDTTTTTTVAEGDRTRVRASDDGQNQWSLPLYSEQLRVGTREVDNGSVRLRKTVRTENASQPVELRRETVVIDREAFDRARHAADAGQTNAFGMAFQDREIVIDLKRQEPVVEVQPYVSGRIVAEKRTITDRQDVTRQVRHENVEVIKNGNDRDITVSERVRAEGTSVGAPGTRVTTESGTTTTPSDRTRVRDEAGPGPEDRPNERPPAKGGANDLQPNKLQ